MRAAAVRAICLLTVFHFAGSFTSAAEVGFEVTFQRMSGHTTYRIHATQFIPDIGADVRQESELEFPLDAFLVGGCLKVTGKLKRGVGWSVSLGAARSMTDPSGYMKDSDWIVIPQFGLDQKFSYTESDAGLEALLIFAEGRLEIVRRPKFSVELLGGYEYQDFSFEISGLRGWQGFEPDELVRFDTLQGVNVLDCDVTYYIAYGGMGARFQFSPRVDVKIKSAIAPNLNASDHDDHLLRFKTADSECSGWALRTGADLRWMVFGSSGESNWSFGFGFGYTKINTKGQQNQTWYGDDPASPDVDDTGTGLMGINDKITSDQVVIRARIGYEF